MSHFLHLTTRIHLWLYPFDNSLVIKVSRLATSYRIKFEVGADSADLSLTREDMQLLRDKINEELLKEEPNA